jgi:hypothetical protein
VPVSDGIEPQIPAGVGRGAAATVFTASAAVVAEALPGAAAISGGGDSKRLEISFRGCAKNVVYDATSELWRNIFLSTNEFRHFVLKRTLTQLMV